MFVPNLTSKPVRAARRPEMTRPLPAKIGSIEGTLGHTKPSGRPACHFFPLVYTRSSQSIKIGVDLSLDKSIKIGKSHLIDIDCIDQSAETYDTLVSFIDLSRFYRFHRFISEDTSVLLFIQK